MKNERLLFYNCGIELYINKESDKYVKYYMANIYNSINSICYIYRKNTNLYLILLGSAVELCITLLSTMSLWCGIMKIVQNTSLINKLTNLLKPITRKLFPEIKENSVIHGQISMNIIANILGLGNAATPIGIKAMKSMQEENKSKDTLTDSMAMFIIINTASIQIIPTTVIAIRNSLNSNNSTIIILPVWIATISALIAGIIAAKILKKRF